MARVLVVEDDRLLADLLRQLLTIRHHTVSVVHNGNAAMAAVSQEPPDIVLMDITLPGQPGDQIAAWMRASDNPTIAAIPIIAMPASSASGDAFEGGLFTDVLAKPFSVDALIACISQHARSEA